MALAAALIMLVGYPECGLTNAPELLPAPFGTIGQLLPPGAAGSLLRSTAFFHGHGAAKPILVLALWLAGGLGLVFLGDLRARRAAAANATPETRIIEAGAPAAASEMAVAEGFETLPPGPRRLTPRAFPRAPHGLNAGRQHRAGCQDDAWPGS